jgi:hypothetical protein
MVMILVMLVFCRKLRRQAGCVATPGDLVSQVLASADVHPMTF